MLHHRACNIIKTLIQDGQCSSQDINYVSSDYWSEKSPLS